MHHPHDAGPPFSFSRFASTALAILFCALVWYGLIRFAWWLIT